MCLFSLCFRQHKIQILTEPLSTRTGFTLFGEEADGDAGAAPEDPLLNPRSREEEGAGNTARVLHVARAAA